MKFYLTSYWLEICAHCNMEILSTFCNRQGAYYTWGHIIFLRKLTVYTTYW